MISGVKNCGKLPAPLVLPLELSLEPLVFPFESSSKQINFYCGYYYTTLENSMHGEPIRHCYPKSSFNSFFQKFISFFHMHKTLFSKPLSLTFDP